MRRALTAAALAAGMSVAGTAAAQATDSGPRTTGVAAAVSPVTAHVSEGGVGGRHSAYFTSAFNGPDPGWRKVIGQWTVRDGALRATGSPGRFTSVRHVGTYDEFAYRVTMRRRGNSDGSAPNCLIVRADPSHVVRDLWRPGYYFCYSNNGMMAAFVVDSRGGTKALMPWTPVVEVGTGSDFRTVEVVATDDFFAFSVNGSPAMEFRDTTVASGAVGVGFYVEPGKRGSLAIDEAELGSVKTARS